MKSTTIEKISSVRNLIIFIILTIFGIIFLSLSIMLVKTPIPENYVQTEATISEIEEKTDFTDYSDDSGSDKSYYVYVDYVFEGKEYKRVSYPKYSSSMNKNDTVVIYVNPDNPGEIMSDKSGEIIFPVISGVITAAGIVGLIYTVYKKKKRSN